ncbi:hypothetical protein [Agrobacterium tumefaciens]|uniref:Uncharacterized protein n=1 Tax=Agrobacterium tumefaciens TaxID=358 RepID=A0A176X911_AGRTU|nr:hypothetical protein [Agrobacterium tumefaciens]OAE43595.1 hypothetical protein A7J57_04840 [Agrobacterium tumefaciens]
MRAYVLGSMMLWCAFFLVWYFLTPYTLSSDLEKSQFEPSGAPIMSAAGCAVEVTALLAMGDKILKAGGPEVPEGLRTNIETCIAYDAASKDALAKTQLIRFFPEKR